MRFYLIKVIGRVVCYYLRVIEFNNTYYATTYSYPTKKMISKKQAEYLIIHYHTKCLKKGLGLIGTLGAVFCGAMSVVYEYEVK